MKELQDIIRVWKQLEPEQTARTSARTKPEVREALLRQSASQTMGQQPRSSDARSAFAPAS